MSNPGQQESETGTSDNLFTWYIRNMLCSCSLMVVRQLLEQNNVEVVDVCLGKVKVRYAEGSFSPKEFDRLLQPYGLSILKKREEQLVSQIKVAIIELVHEMNNVDSIVRKSDYLVEKLGFSYPYLSKHFSDHEQITLEKYIILQKIERIKHLLDTDEYSLSEIAYMMDYSSVQYLSNQFRQITGMTVSQYKRGDGSFKVPIDTL
jgi:AraC family transcriptional regulator